VKAETYQQIRKVFRFFRRYIWYILATIPFSAIASSSRGGAVLLAKNAIDKGIVQKDINFMFKTALILIGIFLGAGVSRVISSFLAQIAIQSTIKDIRQEIIRRLLNIPLNKQKHSSSVISRISADVEIISGLPSTIISLIREPLSFIFLAGVLIYMNPKLAVLSIISFFLILAPVRYITKKVRKASERTRESTDKISEKVMEAIQGAKVVRTYAAESFYEATKNYLKTFKRYKIKSAILPELSSSISEFGGAIVVAAVIIFSSYQLHRGEITAGSFLAFFGAVIAIWEPVKRFVNAISEFSKTLPSIIRVNELDEIPEIKSGNIKKTDFSESIEFRDVWVSFDSEPVLRGISFKVSKGEKVAIIGSSGVGKTTLVSLIPRFFDPQKGEILIDGLNIKDIEITSLRNLISIVEQEPFIFDDTIYNNVAFAKPGAKREEVEKALKIAELDLSKIPGGLNFRCGENGKNLSQGQRHRIAIARAILKNSPIVIMDEPTASLDPKLEQEIMSSLEKLMEGKTVFIVSHKLKTTQWAQRYFLLKDGKMYEITREKLKEFFLMSAEL
jgi:subfamily B ATP-binding cassette protein MsbA